MPSIYISGPMTGVLDLNRSAFQNAAQNLRGYGWDPINPHDIPVHDHGSAPCPLTSIKVNPDSDHSWQCWMRQDLVELVKCDAVAMLPGWEGSHGARAEHALSAAMGLPIYYDHRHDGWRTSWLENLPEHARMGP